MRIPDKCPECGGEIYSFILNGCNGFKCKDCEFTNVEEFEQFRSPKNKQVVQRILSGKRISLPTWFMEENNLEEGDWVLVQEVGNSLRVVPAVVVPKFQE